MTPNPGTGSLDLRDYLRILRKRWLLIAALAAAGLAAAIVVSMLTTPTYRASTLVFVSVQSSGAVTELAQGNTFTQGQVKSYAEVVSTPRVLSSVIDDLGLEESAQELADSVTAQAPLDTVNIEISVTRASPEEAALIANAVTASFRTVIGEITRPTNGDPSPVSVSVLRAATTPTEVATPDARLNLALGGLLGLALGLALAVLIELLDTRIRNERDLGLLTSAPVLGGIAFDRDAPRRPLIVQAEPNSARAEAFRALRTNLQFLDVEGGPRSFVVTSSVPEEGKSTTVANLAISIAQSGARVLVIDADLRRPRLAEYLGLESAVGLSDVLIGRVPVESAVQRWGLGSMFVLPAGTRPPNPSELLGSQAMVTLLRTFEKQFDTVLFDVPPLLPVTDAALLAKQTRGALMAVASGRTHRAELAASLSILDNVGARVSGLVVTMLPIKGADRYGFGRYEYAYSAAPVDSRPPVRLQSVPRR